MDLYEETIKVLKQYKITANKKLGQNFLIDEKIIGEIIKAANISKKDLIIEIGPGIGSLTKSIIPNAGKTICIELDKKMANIISNRFKNEVEIINEDILKVDLKKIAEQNKDKNIKVVANLPYYITTPIIMKLLESNLETRINNSNGTKRSSRTINSKTRRQLIRSNYIHSLLLCDRY